MWVIFYNNFSKQFIFVDLRDKDNGRISFRLSLLPPLATKCYLYNVKVTECVLLFCLNRGRLDKYLPCPKAREKGNYIEKGFAYFLIFPESGCYSGVLWLCRGSYAKSFYFIALQTTREDYGSQRVHFSTKLVCAILFVPTKWFLTFRMAANFKLFHIHFNLKWSNFLQVALNCLKFPF